jgi:hypothetical protein
MVRDSDVVVAFLSGNKVNAELVGDVDHFINQLHQAFSVLFGETFQFFGRNQERIFPFERSTVWIQSVSISELFKICINECMDIAVYSTIVELILSIASDTHDVMQGLLKIRE